MFATSLIECNSWQGPYPTIVKKRDGRQAAVVQAFAYTKYLGKIRLPAANLFSKTSQTFSG